MATPLLIIPAASGTNGAPSPIFVDSVGALSPVLFRLLLADLSWVPERASVELDETPASSPPAAEPGRSERRAPPTQKPEEDNTEAGVLWLPLFQMPATLAPYSRLKFGPDVEAPAATEVPTAALRTLTSLQSGPGHSGPVGVEAGSGPDASTVEPHPFASVHGVPVPRVVLEGSMRDHPFDRDGAATGKPQSATAQALQSLPEGAFATKCEAQSHSGESPVSLVPLDPEDRDSGPNGLDASRKQLSVRAQGVDRSGSLAAVSPSTASQSSLVASRPNDGEWPTKESAPPVRTPPLDHVGDNDSAGPISPTRSLIVRLQESLGRPVDVRFVESRGTVKVTVLTEDTKLARAIASDLPNLERGLESKGWSSELRVPPQGREGHLAEPLCAQEPDRLESDVQLPGAHFGHSEQDTARRQFRTNWAEEIEDRRTAAALRRLSI